MVPMHLKISCFFLDVPESARCGPAASLRLEEGRRKGAPVVSQYQPGSRLAERARRAIPDPQYGLASTQRDLLHGCGEVLGSLLAKERFHPAEVFATSHVRRTVHRRQVHCPQQAGGSATRRLVDEV